MLDRVKDWLRSPIPASIAGIVVIIVSGPSAVAIIFNWVRQAFQSPDAWLVLTLMLAASLVYLTVNTVYRFQLLIRSYLTFSEAVRVHIKAHQWILLAITSSLSEDQKVLAFDRVEDWVRDVEKIDERDETRKVLELLRDNLATARQDQDFKLQPTP